MPQRQGLAEGDIAFGDDDPPLGRTVGTESRLVGESHAVLGQGASVMDSKRALEQARGDSAKAQAILNGKAEKTAQKKADREVRAGVVESYIHS